MKKFILHGDMAQKFCESITLEANTMREAIVGISSNFPKFRQYFLDQLVNGVDYVFVDTNDQKYESFCFDLPLLENEYHIVPNMQGASGSGDLATTFLQKSAIGFVMQLFTNTMDDLAADDGTPEYEIITTNSFIYSQNENRVEQGSPIPVVYGQLRVGSKVIQSSIQNYDYDYDKAVIYNSRTRDNNFIRIVDLAPADYSVVDPSQFNDLRNKTQERFGSYSFADASKRVGSAGISFASNKFKTVSTSQENEPVNQFYGGGGGSNEQYNYGPSVGSAHKVKPTSSWWNHGSPQTNRPFLFPPAGQLDFDMRPQGRQDLCVERPVIGDVAQTNRDDRCDAWTSLTQPMMVGNRGKYQKLESIGIYKSLDVISEGPIIGLANPITGFDRDNGNASYPYNAQSPTFQAGSIAVGSIRYNAATATLQSENNDNIIPIVSAGDNYQEIGATDIVANGPAVNGLQIFVDSPSNQEDLNIGGISFSDPDDLGATVNFDNNTATGIHYVSANDLFLLEAEDGEIKPNTNTDAAINRSLSDIYISTENTDMAGSTSVYRLDRLARDASTLNTNFTMGNGLGLGGFDVSIAPESSEFEFSANLEKLSAFDRRSTSSVLDMRRFAELIHSESFEDVLNNDFLNNTSTTVPLTNVSWSDMARLAFAGNGATLRTRINSLAVFVVATASWQERISSGGFGSEWVTVTGQATMTIRVSDYLAFDNTTEVSINTNIKNTNCSSSLQQFSWTGGSLQNANYSQISNCANQQTKGPFKLLDIINSNAAFSMALYNAVNNAAGNSLASTTFRGRPCLQYGVGSGSTRSPSARTASVPTYIYDNNANFTSVEVLENGSIPNDGTDDPKGYYCPFLFPRVTIYVIRRLKIEFGSNSIQYRKVIRPTRIESVATVSANGTIDNIVLLGSPGTPVWDEDINSWTPIFPALGDRRLHCGDIPLTFNGRSAGTVTSIEDYGIICEIDKSNNGTMLNMNVDRGGLRFKNTVSDSHNIYNNWANFIRNHQPTFGSQDSLHGLFAERTNIADYQDEALNLSKNFVLDEVPNEWETPNTAAVANLTMERLTVPGLFHPITNSNTNIVYTGRASAVNLANNGDGYTVKNGNGNALSIAFTLYNVTHGVSTIDISDGGLGYRPNSTFSIYGFSESKRLAPNMGYGYVSFKGIAKTNKYGSIESIEIIDKGFGFSQLDLAEDFQLCRTTNNANFNLTETNAIANDVIPADNPTNNTDPDTHFTKRDLIIRVDDAHLAQQGLEGSVAKFYIQQTGLGFNTLQRILNIFGTVSNFTPPTFNVTIENGSLTEIQIVDSGSGYSAADSAIRLSFSSPTLEPTAPISIEDDPDAWARAIFLNDVPIRDSNDRFNYSKFHFDMRIGHYKNSNPNDPHIPNSSLAAESRGQLIQNEFKLPSHTKVIGYPLYGPRNNGEKDYFYTHTIKNPEITSITVSLQINKLHYVYEGDESALYVNLIPLVAAGLGIMLGKFMAESIIEALAPLDPVSTSDIMKGQVVSTGFQTNPCTGTGVAFSGRLSSGGQALGEVVVKTGELARKAKTAAFYGGLFGAAGGLISSYILKYLIKCSMVPFLCFKVGEIIKNSGEIWPAKVNLMIEHGTEGEDLKQDSVVIRGCATNPYVKDIVVDIDPATGNINNFKNRIVRVYRLTRELDPVSGGIIESRYYIDAELHSITEHVEGFFSYPNTALIGTRVNAKDFQDVPKREFLIKGRILSIPGNYDAINGTYSGTWDGVFRLDWTSNPAWVIYDLLTNERYGCGKYGIQASDIDHFSFYEFAQFCDERLDTVIDGVTNDGTPYTERRHMCNLYIDSEREAYEYIKDLLKLYNSTINFSGGKIYITTDSSVEDAGGPVMIFNNSNITEDGFTYASTPSTRRITAASVDYLDERDNYMLKTEYVEDQQGISEHGYSHVKIAGNGITRRGEAHRLCWNKILTRQLEKEVVYFKTGMHAAYLKIGDVINVMDNNKISKHSGGRVVKVLTFTRNNRYNYQVQLDIPVSLIIDNETILFENYVDDADDNRAPQYISAFITGGTGFNLSIFTFDELNLEVGASWMIEEDDENNIQPKPFRVKEIKEANEMEFQIMATEYVEEKYSQVDASSGNLGQSNMEAREYSGHEIIV